MTAGRPMERSASGFTLVEMLVALMILALIASIALPFFAQAPSDSLRLQSATDTFLAALRLTRARAILGNTNAALVIDVDQHTFESPAIPARAFESDIQAVLKIAEPERPTKSRGGFRFFPDGSSTGGDLSLRLHGIEAKICVYWLTGEARRGATC